MTAHTPECERARETFGPSLADIGRAKEAYLRAVAAYDRAVEARDSAAAACPVCQERA